MEKNGKLYSCDYCNYSTRANSGFNKHLTTQKHIRLKQMCNNGSLNNLSHTCNICNYTTSVLQHYTKHLLTKKHLNMKNTQKMESPKIANIETESAPQKLLKQRRISYVCNDCQFYSIDKTNYGIHCLTQKHKIKMEKKEKENETGTETEPECPNTNEASCSYENESDEKKMVDYLTNTNHSSNNIIIDKNVLIDILKQGNDFKQMFVEHIKQTDDFKNIIINQTNKLTHLGSKENTIIHNTNCNNNTRFNLNFFLNEQCKDAMNMNEFIESLEIGIEDLEYVGKHGYINGITKIVANSLSQLGVYKRPIHCTDLKREIIHIKDEDQWKKDNETHEITNKMIEKVTYKNLKLVSPWQKQNPKCEILDSPEYNLWWNIAKQSNGGGDISKNVNQVLKNVAKTVYVDKNDIN